MTARAATGRVRAANAPAPRSPVEGLKGLLDRAEEARLAGDYRTGCELAREALALAREAGDSEGEAGALHMLATQALRLGEYEDAIIACRDATALLEALDGHQVAICNVLTVEALSLTELGMHEEALGVLERGSDIARELADRDLLYWVHNRTGVVHANMGNHALSTEYLMRALSMVDGMDDEARFCILNNVGDNAVHRVRELQADGDAAGAETMLRESFGYVEEALQLARAAAHPYRESICLDNYGMLLALAGDHAAAEQMIEDSRAIAESHGYSSLESSALQHRA